MPQADSVACTFGFAGVEQSFAVPAGVGSLRVTAAGAAGGSPRDRHRAGQVPGGRGAVVTGTVAVTPGSTLYIEVGGPGGTDGQAGFNGGGSAHIISGGGGGASDVRTVGRSAEVYSLATRLLIAAGGGGGGGDSSCVSSFAPAVGGAGGDAGRAGGKGGDCPEAAGGRGGQAATDSLPGAGGTDGANRVSAGTGTYANGGRGYGGGGGGGLFGGGGGGLGIAGITDSGSGGGGGGSSLVPPGGTVALAAGAASVVITYTPVP